MTITVLNSLASKEAHGEFVPTLTCDSPGTLAVTYLSNLGYYAKVGNLVVINIYMGINTFSLGTATGTAFIRLNLPATFTTIKYSALSCRLIGVDLNDATRGVSAAIGGDGTQLYISQTQDNSAAIALPISAFANGDYLSISGSYVTV